MSTGIPAPQVVGEQLCAAPLALEPQAHGASSASNSG